MLKAILEIALLLLVLRFLNNLFSTPKPPQDIYQAPQQQNPTEPKKEHRKPPSDDDYIDYEEVK